MRALRHRLGACGARWRAQLPPICPGAEMLERRYIAVAGTAPNSWKPALSSCGLSVKLLVSATGRRAQFAGVDDPGCFGEVLTAAQLRPGRRVTSSRLAHAEPADAVLGRVLDDLEIGEKSSAEPKIWRVVAAYRMNCASIALAGDDERVAGAAACSANDPPLATSRCDPTLASRPAFVLAQALEGGRLSAAESPGECCSYRSIRGSPKCGKALLPPNQVIADICWPSRVRTIIP